MSFVVYTTARADRDIVAADAWWRANRPAAPDLLREEVELAFERMATFPRLGRLYRIHAGREIRRWLLPATRHYLYFDIAETAGAVTVRAIRHAMRRRGPRL